MLFAKRLREGGSLGQDHLQCSDLDVSPCHGGQPLSHG
jgi:hypothetical protein